MSLHVKEKAQIICQNLADKSLCANVASDFKQERLTSSFATCNGSIYFWLASVFILVQYQRLESNGKTRILIVQTVQMVSTPRTCPLVKLCHAVHDLLGSQSNGSSGSNGSNRPSFFSIRLAFVKWSDGVKLHVCDILDTQMHQMN